MFKNINVLMLVRFLLVIVGVGSSFLLFNGPSVADGKAAVAEYRESGELGFVINYTIGLICLGILVIIGFFAYSLVIQPKKTIFSIFGLIVSMLVFFLIFAIGTSDSQESLALRMQTGQSSINLASAGIYTIGLCLLVGFFAIILGPLMGRYRK
jgi:hypothetical protein